MVWLITAAVAIALLLVVYFIAAYVAGRATGHPRDGLFATVAAAVVGSLLYAVSTRRRINLGPAPFTTQEDLHSFPV